MPPGYEEKDEHGVEYLCRIDKPVYGIPQSGRRLQRKSYPWFRDVAGLRQLDDSDGSVFVYDDPSGLEVFAVGVYVDNLQIVHTAELNADGEALDSESFYASFMEKLKRDWDIVDEGPLEDLLAIEMRRNNDESITLHQTKYVEKLISKFLPSGIPSNVQRNSLPYTSSVAVKVMMAVDVPNSAIDPPFPELVKPYQQRVGALMYLATSV